MTEPTETPRRSRVRKPKDESSDMFTEPEVVQPDGYMPPEAEPEGHPKERTPKPSARRTSAVEFLTTAWAGAGQYLVRSGKDLPVGRVLQIQAPSAGAQLDVLLAGTFLDKLILQPLAKSYDSVSGLGSLLAFPMLVGVYEHSPQSRPVVEGLLIDIARSSLGDLAPALRAQRTKEAKAVKDLQELTDLLDVPVAKGEDPITAFLNMIFAGATLEPEPETESATDEQAI